MYKPKKQKFLTRYFLLTYIVSWFLWLPAVLEGKNIFILPDSDILVKFGSFVPSMAGLYITYLEKKTIGIKGLLRKALNFKFPVFWYVYIFLLMPGITFASYLFASWTGEVEFFSLLLPLLKTQFWLIVPLLLYFVLFQGPLGEEFGWRGYALGKLLTRWNPLISSFILGFIWAVWHLPLFFVPGTIQNTLAEHGLTITFLGYLFYTMMLTILITVLYLKTKKSLFSVLIFHATANFSHGLFTIILTPLGGLSVLLVMLAVTIVTIIVNRRELLCKAK